MSTDMESEKGREEDRPKILDEDKAQGLEKDTANVCEAAEEEKETVVRDGKNNNSSNKEEEEQPGKPSLHTHRPTKRRTPPSAPLPPLPEGVVPAVFTDSPLPLPLNLEPPAVPTSPKPPIRAKRRSSTGISSPPSSPKDSEAKARTRKYALDEYPKSSSILIEVPQPILLHQRTSSPLGGALFQAARKKNSPVPLKSRSASSVDQGRARRMTEGTNICLLPKASLSSSSLPVILSDDLGTAEKLDSMVRVLRIYLSSSIPLEALADLSFQRGKHNGRRRHFLHYPKPA